MRIAKNKWEKFVYPLADEKWTRAKCLDWLATAGFPNVPRSACICCPYHTDREWRAMKEHQPDEFAEAIVFDEKIRKLGGLRGHAYLHSSLVPLSAIGFKTDVDRGQTIFGFADECEGRCGL